MLDSKIKTFLMVCETMNYTRAAEKLYITQPAVSTQIRQLEAEYGCPLFVYSERTLSLTPYGKMLRRYAVTMRHDDDILKQKMAEHAGAQKLMTCGATMTAGPYAAAGRLATFLKENRDTNVRMIVASTKTLLKAVDDGEIDCALIEGYFPRSEYDSIVCSKERFSAFVSPDYVFSRKTVRTLEEMMDERLLIREPGSGTRDILEYCLKKKDMKIEDFPRRMEINSIEVIKELAVEGCGVAFLYEAAVSDELRDGRLKKLQVPGVSTEHGFSLVFRKGSSFSDRYRKCFGL